MLTVGDKVRIIPREDVIGNSSAYLRIMCEYSGKETYVVRVDIPSYSTRFYLNITQNDGVFWRKNWLEKLEN